MADVVAGAMKVSDLNQAQLRLDMEAKAAWLDEDTYLVETLTRKVSQGMSKSRQGGSGTSLMSATRMNHQYRERRLIPLVTTVDTEATAGDLVIEVADPEIFHKDHIIYCPATEELFAMAEDVGGGTTPGEIAVRKLDTAAGTGIVTTIPVNSVLINLGESHAEGEAIPPAYATKETDYSTYIYQFDRTRESTDIEKQEDHYGPSEIINQRKQFWIEVKRQLNMMLYLGQNTREILSSTPAGARRHVLKGIRQYTNSNRYDASGLGGGLTLEALGNIARPTWQHTSASKEKCYIAGLNAWGDLSAWGDSAVRIRPGSDQKWGVTLREVITPFGTLVVGYDQMLRDDHGLADVSFILDLKHVYQMQLQGKPLEMLTNRVNPTEVHTERDVITGTRGLVMKLPELHREVYGLPA